MRVVVMVNFESLCVNVDAQHYIEVGTGETARHATCAAETVYYAYHAFAIYTDNSSRQVTALDSRTCGCCTFKDDDVEWSDGLGAFVKANGVAQQISTYRVSPDIGCELAPRWWKAHC